MRPRPPVHILTCGHDKKVTFLNVSTGAVEDTASHSTKIFHIAQLSDEEFATTGYDNNVAIWDFASRKVRAMLRGHRKETKGICYDPNSELLFTGSRDNTVRVWKLPNGEPKGTFTDGMHAAVYGVALCPTVAPNKVFCGCWDHTVRMWDYVTMKAVRKASNGHLKAVHCVCRASEEGMLFSGASDFKAIFWDARDLDKTAEVRVEAKVISLCFRAIKKQVVVGSHDGRLSVYDIRNHKAGPLTIYNAHTVGDMWSVNDVMNPDIFVSASLSDKTTRAWDDTGSKRWEYVLGENAMCAVPFHVPFSEYLGVEMGFIPPFADKREDERISLIVDDDKRLSDISLHVGSNSFRLPRCLLVGSSIVGLDEIEEFRVSEDEYGPFSMIDSTLFVKTLLGATVKIPDRSLPDLFALFAALNMKKHAYLICQHVELIEDPGEATALLHIAMERFEKKEKIISDTDETWTSPFSLACLNALKNKIGLVKKQSSLLKELAEIIDIDALLAGELREHSFFQFASSPPATWSELGLSLRKELHPHGKLSDVTLKTADGSEFRVHLPHLIWKLNFFAKMMRFRGAEATSAVTSGTIQLEELSGNTVESLLEYVYFGSITTTDFRVLLPLMRLSEMHGELAYRDGLMRKIKDVTMDMAGPALKLSLEPVAECLQDDDLAFGEIKRYWVARKMIGEGELDVLIARNVEKREASTRVAKLEAEVAVLKREKVGSEEKSAGLEKRMDNLEAKVDSILQTLAEMKRSLSGD